MTSLGCGMSSLSSSPEGAVGSETGPGWIISDSTGSLVVVNGSAGSEVVVADFNPGASAETGKSSLFFTAQIGHTQS